MTQKKNETREEFLARCREYYRGRYNSEEAKSKARARYRLRYQSSNEERIRSYNKYIANRGDYRNFCDEDISLIENYELAKADDFRGWDLHHRLELEDENGNRLSKPRTVKDLKELGLYNHRPASELIYMRHSEHASLHNKARSTS